MARARRSLVVGSGLLVVLLHAACFVSADEVTPWGAPQGGLRTRLTAPRTTFTVGEPIVLQLELRNDAEKTLSFDEPQRLPCPEGLIVRRDGQPVRYLTGLLQTCGTIRPIASGKTLDLGPIRLSELWDCRRPGRHTVQFPATEATWSDSADPDTFRSVLPASNVLELQVVLPADGRIPPLDISTHGAIYPAVAGKLRAPWQGFAANWHDLGAISGEGLDAIAAVSWPDGPFPLRDDRELCLVIRLPECRANDRLTLRSATVDGGAIRLSVARERGAGHSPRVLPYLAFYLEHLLPAGEYTCRAQLLDAGPPRDDRAPGTYSFHFTIQPARR